MKLRKKGRYIALLCLLLGNLLLWVRAEGGGGALELHYLHDGVRFAVYPVAQRTPEEGYLLTGEFEEYPVSVPGEGWREAAATLAAYAARDRVEAAAEQNTTDGLAVFDGLKEGVYLVIGSPLSDSGAAHIPAAFLTEITEGATVSAYVKYDREDVGEDGDEERNVSYTVEKRWKGDEKSRRPQRVTVQLLRNGELYGSAVLKEDNGWKYTWEGTGIGGEWQVVEEEVPEGYTVSLSRNGRDFTLTNAWKTSPLPPEPTASDEPAEPTPVPEHPADPTAPDGPALPQTGQLWWPVGILLFGGGMMIWLGGRSGKDEE